MSDHAVYSPSSGHRWAKEGGCTASAEAIAHLPPQDESDEAAKGTAAHDELARCLGNLNGETVDPATMPILPVNPDHPSAYGIALMLKYVRQLPPGRMWVEQRIEFTKDIWGRADVQHFDPVSETLTIPDLKDGFVDVQAVENEQLRIYGAAAIFTHCIAPKYVRYVIVQPNSWMPVPRVKQWIEPTDPRYPVDPTWEKPKEPHKQFIERVAGIPKGPKEFKAGEHCRYCPLFGRCKPTSDLLANLSLAMQHEPGRVAPDQIAPFMVCKKPIEDYFKALEKHATKLALSGVSVAGMKLVQTSKHRAWVDGDQARQMIFKHVGVEGLDVPTPAQAEKMKELPAGWVEKNTMRPEGGPALAFESDKRAAFERKSAAEMFAAVTEANQ